jgi:hypothetical protein
MRGLVAVRFISSAFARSGTHAAGAVQRPILREALAVALESCGHQASAIALTANQGAAVIASYQPVARRRLITASLMGGELSPCPADPGPVPGHRSDADAGLAGKREWYDEEVRAAHVCDVQRNHQRWSGGCLRQWASLARGC